MQQARHVESLRRSYAEQKRALDLATQEFSSSRSKRRWVLGAAFLLGLVVSGWAAHQVYQIIALGYVLDCPRLSSLDCRRLSPDDFSYWVSLAVRIMICVLFFLASLVVALFIRALSTPPPVLQMMRDRLRRLQADLEVFEHRQ